MRLTDGWLVAALPDGLLAVRAAAAYDLGVEPDLAEGAVSALAADFGPAALTAALGSSDGRRLLDDLESLGAVDAAREVRPPLATPFVDGLLAALDGSALPRVMATADELLVVPADTTGRVARRLARAFIAGLSSHERLRAYAHAATTGCRTVAGDRPVRSAAATVDRLDPALVHVVDLERGLATVSLHPAELDELGATRIHRLGTAVERREPDARPAAAPDQQICMVRQAPPNLRFPGRGHGYATGIAASREHAELIARAEAAERFAAGDLTDRILVRAAPADLDAPAVEPSSVLRYSERQLGEGAGHERGDPEAELLWTPGATRGGESRWLPAEMVFVPFADPAATSPVPRLTSSGCAAHATLAEARRRAVAELVERDAFMWHWVQRVSRERLERRTLPERLRADLARLEAAGHAVDLVNLTLETKPVVLCAIRTAELLSVAASCRDDATDAAARALAEAATLLWSSPEAVPPVADHRAVRTPLDHLGVYRDPAERERAAFLWSSGETISVTDVRAAPEPVDVAVERIGEPAFVDLTSPGSKPFFVARAFVPGLVPLSFGFDREPLGMARLAAPIALADGRTLDVAREPSRLAPLAPHPFP